jgi:outer membrane protein assembly factor BamB
MTFGPLLRLFVAWPKDKDIFPDPDDRTEFEETLSIRDIIGRRMGDNYTLSESERFYDRPTISETSSRPFEDRKANWEGIKEIAVEISDFVTSGDVDIAQRSPTRGVQKSDVVIRVVNSHADAPTQRWRTDQQLTYTLPVVDHGNVYGLNDDIVAFNGETGECDWTYSSKNYISRVPTTTDDSVLVQDGLTAVSLSPEDGAVEWRLKCGLPLGIASRFEIIDEFVYFGTTQGELYRFPPDGRELETLFTTDENASLDIFSHAHGLFFLNGTARSLEDGTESWTILASKGREPGFVDSSDMHIYFRSDGVLDDGILYAVDPVSGEISWRKRFDATAIATLAVSDRKQMYILAENSVIALNEKNGAEEWEVDLDDLTGVSPDNKFAEQRKLPDNLDFTRFQLFDDQLIVTSQEGATAIDEYGDITWWHLFAQQSADVNGLCQHEDVVWISTDIGDIYGVEISTGRESARYESAAPASTAEVVDGELIVMLKTLERSHFDGHKQRVETDGEIVRLEI